MPFDASWKNTQLNDVALLGLKGQGQGPTVCLAKACYGYFAGDPLNHTSADACVFTQDIAFVPLFNADGSPQQVVSPGAYNDLAQQVSDLGYASNYAFFSGTVWLASHPTAQNPCPSSDPNGPHPAGTLQYQVKGTYRSPASGQTGIYEWPPAAEIAGIAFVVIAVAVAAVAFVRKTIRTGKGREAPVAKEVALAECRYGRFEKRLPNGKVYATTRRLYEGTEEGLAAFGWERVD